MEKIVKKILNYDMPCSNVVRDEMVANIVALALHMLDKTGKYEFPDDCVDIVYKKFRGCVGKTDENMQVHYRKDALKEPEYFFDDIMIIAHEICHVVQNYKKDDKVKNVDLYYSTDDKFDPLLTKIIQICYSQHVKTLKKHGLYTVVEKSDEIKQINDYFKSFYYLQETEREAYEFQVEFMKNIFAIADKLSLTRIEKEKLNIYKIKSQQDIEFMEELIAKSKRFRMSDAVVNKVKYCCEEVMRSIFNKNPNIFKDLTTLKNAELDDIYEDLYDMVCILEISYNNDIAHKLFNGLIKSRMMYYDKAELMNELFGFTPIRLDDAQTSALKEIMEKYNKHKKCKLIYDILSKDKLRVERENVMFSPPVK